MKIKKIYSRFTREKTAPMKLEGYAYKWGDVSDYMGVKEKIKKGAFMRTLSGGHDVMMYLNHDPTKVIGKSGANMNLKEDDTGLKFEVDLPDTSEARDAFELVKKNIIEGVSVGMGDYVADDNETDVREIIQADLREISLTQTPVYEQTEVNARNKKQRILPPELC